ncbi:hypothetical protein ACN38_g5154 [Penicillium nordicum]|uniref:Uncharacterized protein n=1 Tax=Penicillium nordicum TaxID=229535 RepID=A0A0M8PAV3_9EURO|nr:hypothetical protein ACN38_g5154 [Penicillium nordicum]
MMSNKRQVFVSLDHRDSLCRQEQTAILNLLESTTLADVCDLRKCLRSLGFDTVTQGPESDALSLARKLVDHPKVAIYIQHYKYMIHALQRLDLF